MDPELKALLDQAHAAGANESQLQGIVDLYNTKKKSQSGTSLEDSGATFIQPHPSSSNADATTSLLEQGAADLKSISQGQAPATFKPHKDEGPNDNNETPDKELQPSKPTEIPGFRTVDPKAIQQSPESFQKFQAIKETAEKDPGSWSLFSTFAPINTGLAGITDALSGYSKALENVVSFNHPEMIGAMSGASPIPLKISPLFDWASDYLKAGEKYNPLPNNFAGNVVKGFGETTGKIAPLLLSGGGTAAAEGGALTGTYLTQSQIVQQAVTQAAGPMTRYLGAVGAGEGLNRGSNESGGKIIPTLVQGLQGLQEGVESGITLEAQMAGGQVIGGKLFNLAVKSGVVNEDGLITQQALKSIVGSPSVFGLYSVADDAAHERPINWQNAGISMATALPFEAQHLIGAAGDAKDLTENKRILDENINKAIETTGANSIINFATASQEDVHNAMTRPESSAELQIQALAHGVKAQDAKTVADKNTYHMAQLETQQQADIKSIGETVLQHGVKGFAEAVDNTQLPDEIKSTLLIKANEINKNFNPVVVKETETKETVNDLNNQIDHLQNQPGATDPVENPAGVADLIEMVDKRTDLQVDLLDNITNNPEQVINRPVLYHGSSDNFESFDQEKLGLFTNSESAKKGFFFTSSPDVANTYKQAGIISRPNIDGLKDHLDSLSEGELQSLHKDLLGKYTGYSFDPEHPKDAINEIIDAAKEDKGNHIADKRFITDQIAKHETNQNRDYRAYETDGKLHQVHLDMQNPYVIDAKGGDTSDVDINKIIDEAKAANHDGVVIKNIHDEALLNEKGANHDPSDIHIVFNRDQIKKLDEQEKLQKENEAPAAEPEGAPVPADSEDKGLPGAGFQFKSKEHGTLAITPGDSGEYTVHFKDGSDLKGTPEDIKAFIPDFDEKRIGAGEAESELYGTDNPKEIAKLYDDKIKELQEPSGGVENAIAAYGPTTDAEKFGQQDDPNSITGGIRLNYFRKEGVLDLDTQAQEINDLYFNGAEKVTEQDITDFMKKYPGGPKSFSTPAGNPELREIANRYKEVTGKNLSGKRAQKLADEFSNVSPKEIRKIQEQFEGPENTEKIKRFIDDQMSKPGLHDPETIIKNLGEEFDKYLQDPDNSFNLFHEVYNGDILSEEEIKTIRDEIENTKNEQLGERETDTEPADQAGSEAPIGEENQSRPSEVEVEYDASIEAKRQEVRDFEKQIEKKLTDLSKKNDLFEAAGVKKGEEAQGDIFDKTATNTEPENISKILEPLRGKLETAKRELADLEKNRDAVFEQAKNQLELDDLPFQRGAGERIPTERAEVIQDLMKKVFPNVETIFHPTVESFAEAAKLNHIDASDLPNAFVDGKGKINFNPESINADTQIHEYGHILTQWAKENAPALFNRMIAFGRDAKEVRAELAKNGYTLTESRMAEEAFVTMLGRHGEGKLDEVIKNGGTRGTISKFINDLWTKFQRYLIEKTGFDISKFQNIKDMPIHEFLDTINSKYLLSDTKVSDIGTKEYSQGQVDEQKSTRPKKKADETMAQFAQRIIDWTKEQQTGQKAADFTEDVNKPEEKNGYEFSETSIKNRVTAQERRARDMEEVEVTAKRDFGTVWESGKKMVDDGTIDPKVLADNLIERPRPLSAEESAALVYDRMRLYNDHRVTMDNIQDAMESGNTAAEMEARVRQTYIEERINNNDIAARKAGYEQGLGLAARKMMIAKDYSLANQLQLAMTANLGKALPADVRMKMESLSKQLEVAEKKLADYEANQAARAAVTSLARLRKEVEAEVKVQKKQKRVESKAQIKKNIDTIKSDIYAKLFQNKKTTSSIVPYADRLIEITPDLAKLAKEYIKDGIVTVDGIVDEMHSYLKDHLEGVTKRDIRDALSGYGKTSKPSKDVIEAQLRELKAQARLTSALEDALNGERPLKSGYTHEPPSQRVRELQKRVHEAMKENGIEVEHKKISDEDAWKSALDAVKTRLKNQIDDLNKQLETGIKPEMKGRVIYDQEANDLKAERDRLKEAIGETEGDKKLSDEERVKRLLKSTQDSIEDYERRIKEKDFSTKPSDLKALIDKTPELKAMRERLDKLREDYQELKDAAKPKRTPEEVAIDAFKKRMNKKLADLQEKIDNEDYAKPEKKEPLALDGEGKRLKTEVNKLQRKFDENREKIRLANRSALEKRLDWAAKYRRFILLSNVTTLFKLSAAGATRLVTSPLEEVAGHAMSYLPGINKISSMAPREGGGLSIKAEAESLAKVLSRNSINEMVRTIREGKSALDERVDQKEKTFKEGGFFELPGQIHAALKTVPKQVEYYRSLQKRIEFALRNGYDITSPDVQTSLQVESFKDQYPDLFTGKTVEMSKLEYQAFNDGKRAIFMQDNFLSDEWTAMIKRWETKGPKGNVAATIARIFLPIIKIPTNFVAESSSLAFGGVKAIFALRNGIEKLTPDEADYVMRALKKQSVGAGFFALGYFLPQFVGGFYRQDEKRKKGDPEADDLVIMGEKVPHWLMHAPVFEIMQMGATVRRVHEQYKKNSRITAGDEAVTSTLAATKGLFGQVPMFGEAADLTRGLETAESLKKFSANFVLGLVVPYDVQRVAKWMDEDSHGEVIKRKEKGFIQHLESGVPVLRKELKRK